MEVFYDGINVDRYANDDRVTGFTTNCTIFSTSPYKSYNEFYSKFSDVFKSKPVSFQIWEDDTKKAIDQIDEIYGIGPNIFVKIPIVNSVGESNDAIIEYAVSKNVPVNLTAIYTMDQICKARQLLKTHTAPAIVSVFAGSISDLFIEPSQYISYAKYIFKDAPNCRILWAGCREVYAVARARDLSCDIITIPDGVIEKFNIIHKSLGQLSVERARQFRNDALRAQLSIQ
jgi:transaldolase